VFTFQLVGVSRTLQIVKTAREKEGRKEQREVGKDTEDAGAAEVEI